MWLTLGSRAYDLTDRALVMGVGGVPADMVAEGADIVELDRVDERPTVPACVVADGVGAAQAALASGADLVRLPSPGPAELRLCAQAGVAVVVPDESAEAAAAAGFAPDRVVVSSLVLDVVGDPCPLGVTVAGILRGARIVRTDHVRVARRVRDVLAAVAGAEA